MQGHDPVLCILCADRCGVCAIRIQCAIKCSAILGHAFYQRALQNAEPVVIGKYFVVGIDHCNRPGAASANYRAKVRGAVREVEEALLSLQSAADRLGAAAIATEGYSAAFVASEARFKSGLGSLSDLEDTRRTALAAKTALLNLERERSAAWVALYRAVGGGWSSTAQAM